MKNMLKTEYVDPKTLKFAEYNPRNFPEKSMAGLKASIIEFGMVDALVVNRRNNTIVGGHMRCQAALDMGIDTIPIVYVDLSLVKEKALNVTLNNRHIQGEFTLGLQLILDELDLEIGDISKELRLDELRNDIPEPPEPPEPPENKGKTDKDKIPDMVEKPVIKTGDLIILGKWVFCPECGKKYYIK